MRLDLHVHSEHSPDSRMTIEQAVERVSVGGLNGFALTDHNSVRGHARLHELAGRYPRLLLVPGVEVSTEEGHLLVYGVAERPPPGRPLSETLEWARARNGVTVLAHPFRWAHGVGRGPAETAAADGIEVVNGHNSALANARAELVAARRGGAATGGSDAHTPGGIGRAFTEFPDPVDGVEGVLDLLRRGRTEGLGRSLSALERVPLALRTAGARALRGFRSI